MSTSVEPRDGNAPPSTDAGPPDRERPLYAWEKLKDAEGIPAGEHLAAFRRGWNAEPGALPTLWAYYTTLTSDGRITRRLRAEHLALTLFGLHQQGQSRPVHAKGVRLGEALRSLRTSGRYSEAALDRRVASCATADDVTEFAQHLRGLISMLKTLKEPQGLDYSQLVADLTAWQSPDRIGRIRRRLGADYFRHDAPPAKTPNSP